MRKIIRYILKVILTFAFLPVATIVTMFMIFRRLLFGKENKIAENLQKYYDERKRGNAQ